MSNRIPSLLCLLLLACFPYFVDAQCYGNAQAESWTCGSSPLTMQAFTTCGNCTHTWSPAPQSGQGTALATYQWSPTPGFGVMTGQVSSSSYNPNVPCSYGDMWQVGVASQPNLPLPALVNGPWNGDTSKVWIYTRNYMNPNGITLGLVDFYPSWTVTGGVKLRSVNHRGNVYYDDSVFVKWAGPTNMHLNEAQFVGYYPHNMLTSFACNWVPPASSPGYPSLAVFNHPVCQGSPATFFTFPFANSTYTWSVSNGTVASGQGTNSAGIILNGPATVTVVRDSAGTITTANSTVTPFVPVVNLGPDQNLCQGSSLTLTANSGFTSYQWSNGATTQSITVSNPGQYRVTATINGNCSATDTINLTPILTTRPNLGPDQYTCTFPVTLDAGPGYVSYAWSNGATTQVINPMISGTYRVTVTDVNGCLTSDTALIYNVQPSVSLPTTANYCAPGPYAVSPSYSNVTSYLWSTGATTPTIQLTATGTQSLWIRGTNTYGCIASDTIVVTGNPRPTPNIGPDQTICPGTSVTLDAGPGFSSYIWSGGPASQTYTVSTPGSYRVTVYNSFGCSASDTILISNYPFTPVNLGPDINVCQPSATLNAGGGYSSYLWSNGATTQSITVTSSGNYSVTVSGAGGCTSNDAIDVIFSNFSFSLGNNVTVCEPQTVTLNPQLIGNFTYNWSTGASTPALTLTVPGTYNVTLTVANNFGCTAADTVSVTILPTLPSLLGGDTILCADTSITLNVGSGFSSYAWSTGANTQSIVAASGGVYRVTATAPNGCVRLDTVMISGLIDCVFPGDANYDGVADLMDVLALGTVVGQTGPARANASTQWYGQQAWNWNGAFPLPFISNFKQADSDGNGLIQAGDTMAVHQNYGSQHTKVGTITGGNEVLRVIPLNTNVAAGDLARFAVYYEGPQGSNVDSIHGLALKLSWPSLGVANAGLKFVDFSSAWFAPANNRMTFLQSGANSVDLALSRLSGTDTSGQGIIMILGFQTDSSLVGSNVTFAPTVNFAQGVSMSLIPKGMQPNVVAATVIGAVATNAPVATEVRVWPIPADDILRIAVDGQLPRVLRLVNMLGQTVLEVSASGEREFALQVADLPAGGYSLQILTEDNVLIAKRIVLSH